MPVLTWSDALALQQPLMDDTHREFVAMLAELEAAAEATPAEMLARLDRFVEHTETHFGQEDRWMARIGFSPENCHARQHAEVLQLLREVQRRVRDEAQLGLVARVVPALAEWFVPHARNMDGGLAQVMVATGFDPATGTMTNPPRAPGDEAFQPAATTGCGHG
jgi:hemerythrin-like metal-binding protein